MFKSEINGKEIMFHEGTVGVIAFDTNGRIVRMLKFPEDQLANAKEVVLFRAKADQTVDIIAEIPNEIEEGQKG